MFASAGSLGLLVVLNLVFAVGAVALGFVVGAWIATNRRNQQPASPAPAAPEPLAELPKEVEIEIERTALATDRLRDLATGVASEVGEHSTRMGEITAGLRALDTSNIEATGAGLVSALAKIVAANEALQERLAKAEEQIEVQAREIHLHESEARTDSLTNLANRRAFDDEMKRRCSEAHRKGTPLTLLIMDIDYFKKFNDSHGHQAGDEVLRKVGRKLTETCRDMDLPCRYGGEEFAIVMPATLLADAKIAAERIRTAVENMPVKFEGKDLRVTTSVGLAQLSGQDDIPRLVRRADAALYASKNAGRNCGHWHDGDESHPFTERILKAQQADRARQAKNQPAPLLDSLPNRTRFADELRRRIAESSRTDQPIAVLVVELGNHELVKSQFGGHSSYRALDMVAKALQESLRDMDLLARLSESRFAVMLPENTINTTEVVASRAAQALRKRTFTVGEQAIPLQLRVGSAQHRTGDSVEVLVGRAEADLLEPSEFEAPAVAELVGN
ncbi:diguanylate cyclase domain-containing protein [Aeoliella sp. SH292]|uniref:diguanylate cyclase domain-containing protein n=1 Tax=Aeoliella sp. SH292 TaxID=3454464 RepID=UPI003F96AD7A